MVLTITLGIVLDSKSPAQSLSNGRACGWSGKLLAILPVMVDRMTPRAQLDVSDVISLALPSQSGPRGYSERVKGLGQRVPAIADVREAEIVDLSEEPIVKTAGSLAGTPKHSHTGDPVDAVIARACHKTTMLPTLARRMNSARSAHCPMPSALCPSGIIKPN